MAMAMPAAMKRRNNAEGVRARLPLRPLHPTNLAAVEAEAAPRPTMAHRETMEAMMRGRKWTMNKF